MNYKIESKQKTILTVLAAVLLTLVSITAYTEAVQVHTTCLEPSPTCVNGTVTVPAQEVQANQGSPSESVNVTPIPQTDSPVAPVEQSESSASGC